MVLIRSIKKWRKNLRIQVSEALKTKPEYHLNRTAYDHEEFFRNDGNMRTEPFMKILSTIYSGRLIIIEVEE